MSKACSGVVAFTLSWFTCANSFVISDGFLAQMWRALTHNQKFDFTLEPESNAGQDVLVYSAKFNIFHAVDFRAKCKRQNTE